MKYETKDKGDVGVAKVIADLTEKDIKVALPISEHLPFDLIAIREDGKLSKISVKYRKINNYGCVAVPLRTISSNAKGYKIKCADLSYVDAFAIYCPETKEIYYVGSKSLEGHKAEFSMRIDARSGDGPDIRYAKDYTNVDNIWKVY